MYTNRHIHACGLTRTLLGSIFLKDPPGPYADRGRPVRDHHFDRLYAPQPIYSHGNVNKYVQGQHTSHMKTENRSVWWTVVFVSVFRRTRRCPPHRCVTWWVHHIGYIFTGVSRSAGPERARGHRRHRGSDAAPDGRRLDKGTAPYIFASFRRTGTNYYVPPPFIMRGRAIVSGFLYWGKGGQTQPTLIYKRSGSFITLDVEEYQMWFHDLRVYYACGGTTLCGWRGYHIREAVDCVVLYILCV